MANSSEKKGAANVESALNKNEALFMKNKKAIIYGILAVIIIIGGYLAYSTYVAAPREDEASTALAKGQEYFANQQFDKALNGDGAAFKGFKAIASDYSSTDAGNLANLYAGLCYANLNKWTEAAKALEEYSPANDEMISPAATAALGNAYAHLNQLDKAVETARLKAMPTTVFLQPSSSRPEKFSKARTRRMMPSRSIRTSRRNTSTLLLLRRLTSISNELLQNNGNLITQSLVIRV